MMTYHYRIANFAFTLNTLNTINSKGALSYFQTPATQGDHAAVVNQINQMYDTQNAQILGVYDWFESKCTFLRHQNTYCWLRVDAISGEKEQLVWQGDAPTEFTIYSSMRRHVVEHMMLIAASYAMLSHGALVIHSSVIENDGRGFMFLGESGTGKSTHTSLWIKHITGSMMLNDDGPVVRVDGTKVSVHGSPWSGKGCVYRNVALPIQGIYRLSQAPQNKIAKLNTTQALGAMLHSCLPQLMTVEKHTDMALNILSDIIATTPLFHLECLPDEEAARMSFNQK
ncbi:MAG: hypothetical protein RSD75_07060 [Mucinivorans sp.]